MPSAGRRASTEGRVGAGQQAQRQATHARAHAAQRQPALPPRTRLARERESRRDAVPHRPWRRGRCGSPWLLAAPVCVQNDADETADDRPFLPTRLPDCRREMFFFFCSEERPPIYGQEPPTSPRGGEVGTSRRATVKPSTTPPPPAGRTSGEGKGISLQKKDDKKGKGLRRTKNL